MADGTADVVRSFARGLESRNVDQVLSLLLPDAVYETPSGTFRGTEELRRYFRWMFDMHTDLWVKESGVGILASGDKACFEHTVGGTYGGVKWQLPMLCTYELSGGKIKRLVTLYDRLAMAKQVGKRWMAQWAIGSVIKASEKGLR